MFELSYLRCKDELFYFYLTLNVFSVFFLILWLILLLFDIEQFMFFIEEFYLSVSVAKVRSVRNRWGLCRNM
jgi:hypothetical protein